ncbi:YheU family protein [Bdellovibrio sp. HCB337]|uniref:YheU family protein n=1 Tax=Bdellovibrio sp. HCB337 TaxID=3394358 RepID=UPI0039A502A3
MYDHDEKEEKPPIEVPREVLSSDALNGIIESFILREGTDYGREEVSFGKKYEQVERQLDKGDVKIVFDPNTESVGIVTAQEWAKLIRQL